MSKTTSRKSHDMRPVCKHSLMKNMKARESAQRKLQSSIVQGNSINESLKSGQV